VRARERRLARADARSMPRSWSFPVISVRKVVDGDTLDLELDLGFNIRYLQRVRLVGIDTPEIASKDAGDRERAKAARDFVGAWIARQEDQIRAETTKDDKYGRMLCELHGDSTTLTGELLEARLAKRYR